jgi:hypothetical protein
MRWHIRGTDAVTDQPVELSLHELDAPRAIRAAMARQIVVTHIRRHAGARAKWLIALALCVALGAAGVWTSARQADLRRQLDQALEEQGRMAESVAQAERTVGSLNASGALEKNAATQVAQLAGELAAARSRMSLSDQQLASARQRMTDLEKAAKMAADLDIEVRTARGQLQVRTQEVENLRTELTLQTRRIEELQKPLPDKNLERVAELQKLSAAQAEEIEKLKSELLLLAAQTAVNPALKTVDSAQTPAHSGPVSGIPAGKTPSQRNRWPIGASFDQAHDFLVLHTDPDSLVAIPGSAAPAAGAGDALITSGAWASHAVRLKIEHDRAREQVYSATLEVSLAADAPRDVLADNKALIDEFLKTYAGDLQDRAAVAPAAVQLAGQDAARQLVFLGAATKVTLWNDKTGVYTLRVESAHGGE